MPEIIRITSEALQASVRRLLPSQQGFGDDLQATNLVTPIIDLTPTAEGTQLPEDLARAVSFGSATPFSVSNASTAIANTPGFYKLQGAIFSSSPTATRIGKIILSNGLTNKTLFQFDFVSGSNNQNIIELTVFLDTGESLIAETSDNSVRAIGFTIPIADRYGVVTNPSGFTFE